MIDGMRAHPYPHPLRHEALCFVDDHAILLRHEEPRRTVLPQRSIHRHRDAGGRDWPLSPGQMSCEPSRHVREERPEAFRHRRAR
jgi:hypothetical protein